MFRSVVNIYQTSIDLIYNFFQFR